MTDYTIFDLETSGWGVGIEIIEIGAVRVRGDKVVSRFQQLIKPKHPIDPRSTAVNHITDDMVKHSPKIRDVLPEFADFIGDDMLVGHNIDKFDMPIIKKYWEKYLDRALTNCTFDTLPYARARFDKDSSCSLENLSKYFGLDTEGEHRSLADCHLTKAVYEKLRDMAPDGSEHGIPKSKGK